jgi:hypothetical protein
MDMAPAISPADPVKTSAPRSAFAAPTPTIRLAVETIPPLAPRDQGPCNQIWVKTLESALPIGPLANFDCDQRTALCRT